MTADLGQVGVWAPLQLWLQEPARLPDTAAELEELGFGTVWVANGPGMLDVVASMLDGTRQMAVATGIVNIWTHPADAVAVRHAELATVHPGRLLLGLGNGPRTGEQWGLSPYRRMTAYLDDLDAAGLPADERVLGAVGPRMLALAGARSRGAHPFLSTPEHTRLARSVLGDGPLLAPEQKVVLETDPATARAVARQALAFYLGKRGYSANLLRLGFSADELAGGGSDRLVDSVVAWGDVHTVLARVAEHLAAGADHVALQPLTADTDSPVPERRRLPLEQYRLLAAALAGS